MSSSSEKPHFCSHCHNLLLPTAEGDRFILKCRKCDFEIDKTNDTDENTFRVYSDSLSKNNESSANADISKDPTYPRTKKHCEKCNKDVEVVYFYSSNWKYKCNIQTIYTCTKCGRTWEEGGDPFKENQNGN